MVYLITGATGNVGSLVVERLIARGDRPRVFVRNAEKARARYGESVDVFTGDLADAETLRPALAGADALFLVNSGPELAALDELAAKTAKGRGGAAPRQTVLVRRAGAECRHRSLACGRRSRYPRDRDSVHLRAAFGIYG